MAEPPLKIKTPVWVALLCVVVGMIFSGMLVCDDKPDMDRYLNFSARMVHWVGPWGWLLFSFFCTLLIIRFRASRFSQILLISYLLFMIVVSVIDLFAEYSIPMVALAG